MFELYILIAVFVLAFYVWMFILFFNMTQDVRMIRNITADQQTSSHSSKITMREVNLAILQGRQEETYRRVLTSVYNEICKLCRPEGVKMVPYYYESQQEALDKYISYAEYYCYKLGYELPEQLKSLQAFLEFFNAED